jgi:long-subunit fatty acid transport protein
VAVRPADFVLLGVDVAFSDWTELERELELFAGEAGRRKDYTATTDVRLGAEVTVPSWPVRLRAGYMTRPIAYSGLDIDSDRSYFTLGAGLLIDTVLAIDVAWVKGAYERSSAAFDYEESVDDAAVLVEAAYRF